METDSIFTPNTGLARKFEFFHKMVWEDPSEIFGQMNISKVFFFFFLNTGNRHIYKETCIKHSLDILFLVPVAYKGVVENLKVIGEGGVPGMHRRL